VARLYIFRPGRIIRPRPAPAVVPIIPKGIEVFAMPRRCWVKALAGLKVNTRCDGVYVHAAVLISVQHCCICNAVRWHTCKHHALVVVQNLLNFLIRGRILGRPRDHAAAVFPLKIQPVSNRCDNVRITAQHCNFGPLLAFAVQVLQQILYGFSA